MKCCSHCGSLIKDDSTVCPDCGTPVHEQSVKKEVNESSTLGILSIVFGAMGGFLGVILGIIGLCIYKEKENKQKCIIGICFSMMWPIMWLILHSIIIAL